MSRHGRGICRRIGDGYLLILYDMQLLLAKKKLSYYKAFVERYAVLNTEASTVSGTQFVPWSTESAETIRQY